MKFIDTEIMKKYLQGKADEEEKNRVMTWLMLNLKSPYADKEFEELLEKVPAVTDDARKERVSSRLMTFIAADRKHIPYNGRRRTRKNIFLYTSIAAMSIAVAIMTFALWDIHKDMDRTVAWTDIKADYGEVKELILPDGSHIWLHNDTRVTYPDAFAGRHRQIFVSGEIYAVIEADRRHPFIVSSDNVNVIVKGTTFNMKSYPEMKNAELTLVEGKVAMEYVTSRGKSGLEVQPGETVSVNLKDGSISKFVCDRSEYVSWKDRRAIYFNDKPLSEIASELEREFGVRIIIEDKVLASTRHFASFVNDESVVDILKALCTEPGIEISEKDSTIHINNY